MINGFDGGMMGGWGTFSWLGMLIQFLFWGGILALIAWAITRIFPGQRGGEQPGARGDSAEELLRQRFARGEIDAEEYEERRRILSGGA